MKFVQRRLRLSRLNWFDRCLIAAGLAVIAAIIGGLYIYRWPQVFKFSCQIDRTKPNEPCHFVLDGNNFVAPIQAYVMFPVMTQQSLMRVQLTKTELLGTPFVSFWRDKKLVGFYRIEDTDAFMKLIAESGFAILKKDFTLRCVAQYGRELKCGEAAPK